MYFKILFQIYFEHFNFTFHHHIYAIAGKQMLVIFLMEMRMVYKPALEFAVSE